MKACKHVQALECLMRLMGVIFWAHTKKIYIECQRCSDIYEEENNVFASFGAEFEGGG